MAPRAAKKRPAAKADDDTEPATGPSGKETAAAKPAAKRPRRQTAAAAARGETDSPSASSEAPNISAGSEPPSEPDSGSEPESKPQTRSKPPAKGAKAAGRAGGGRNGGTGAKKAAAQGPQPREGAEDGGSQGRGSKGSGKAKAKGAAGTSGVSDVAARDPPGRRYFLMKSEPEEFSLDDLAAKKESTSHWEGVRNAQARNIMRSMRVGDEAFFYHSSCKVPAVVGVVRVVREAYPDHFAFNKGSKYYDPRSTPDSPKWWMVDVQLVRRLARPVTLAELRAEGARGPPIADMVLINKSRLSVQPVTEAQWERILKLESAAGSGGQGGDGEDSE